MTCTQAHERWTFTWSFILLPNKETAAVIRPYDVFILRWTIFNIIVTHSTLYLTKPSVRVCVCALLSWKAPFTPRGNKVYFMCCLGAALINGKACGLWYCMQCAAQTCSDKTNENSEWWGNSDGLPHNLDALLCFFPVKARVKMTRRGHEKCWWLEFGWVK